MVTGTGSIFRTAVDERTSLPFTRNGWRGMRRRDGTVRPSRTPSPSNVLSQSVSADINSHNQSNNLSHYLHNDSNEHASKYQSRQRKHRSSQNPHDRRRATSTQHHQQQQGFSAGNEAMVVATDEARYNLATRVMSNGVEVIVAGDKTTLPGGHPNNHLRILTSSYGFKMPMTLAPSTLKDHMLLMLPQSTAAANNTKQNDEVRSFLAFF